MRSRGWLDESRVWKGAGSSIDVTLTLRPLVRKDLPGFLAVETPRGYLIEFRVEESWDGGIPKPAVFVHRFDDGHSYLMAGTSGTYDLVAGDSFGNAEARPTDPFHSFERVDVLSIDPEGQKATLRLRYRHAQRSIPVAIDPMAVILPDHVYRIWVEKNHPHVPKVAEVQAVPRTMTPDEQAAALNRARELTDCGKVVQEAMAGLRRTKTR